MQNIRGLPGVLDNGAIFPKDDCPFNFAALVWPVAFKEGFEGVFADDQRGKLKPLLDTLLARHLRITSS